MCMGTSLVQTVQKTPEVPAMQFGLAVVLANTTPQMTRFRGAKVCSKWLQERIDDHNIQSDYKGTIGLKVSK